MDRYVRLAAFLLFVQLARLERAQPASVSLVQPLVDSEGPSQSGTIVSEPSLPAQMSASSDAMTQAVQLEPSFSNAFEMTSSVVAESSPTLMIPSVSSSPLPSVSSSSDLSVTAVFTSSSSQAVPPPPSPSASAVSPFAGSITSNNLTQEFVGMCFADIHAHTLEAISSIVQCTSQSAWQDLNQ